MDVFITRRGNDAVFSVERDYAKEYEKSSLAILLVMVGFIASLLLMSWGMDRNERVECNSWKAQSAQFPAFYLTKWQKEQCDTQGIAISAPIK